MKSTENNPKFRSEIIRSDSLYLKEFEAKEKTDRRGGRLFSGTRIKAFAIPFLYGMLEHAPRAIVMLPIHFSIFILRLLYWWPKNPIRLSCEYICILAERKGYTHDPRHIYNKFLSNAVEATKTLANLYHNGIDAAADQIQFTASDTRMMNDLIEEYGGAIIAVPHNFGSLLSALKMNREFPFILITKNSSTIERTKIAIDVFERMETTILMVRGGNPFLLSRSLFSILKSGKSVAATLDSMDSSANRIEVQMFGRQIGFSPWAAKISVRMGVPVIPTYASSRDDQIVAIFGKPLFADNVEKSIQHYVSFFDENILKDPASWGFLGDKSWRRVLRDASRNIE
jgi:lauroyl/myristoyl acyltransferase